MNTSVKMSVDSIHPPQQLALKLNTSVKMSVDSIHPPQQLTLKLSLVRLAQNSHSDHSDVSLDPFLASEDRVENPNVNAGIYQEYTSGQNLFLKLPHQIFSAP